MKKKLALFLAFIMLLGLVPTNVFAANTAKPVQASDKAYEEVIIDGAPYKVYKLADFIDGHSEENTISLMSRSAKPFGSPAPTGTSDIKFVLDLSWETIDRPIDNVIMPVYFGPPSDSRSIKFGYFVVNSFASPGAKQRIEMVQEYSGTSPSIDYLVEKGFSKIKIAIPEDMRYDFILASAKWDASKKEGTTGVDKKVVFNIEGKQSVMHGYGIRWFDSDAANREKIDARWEGKKNQTSDVKLGIENRDYSVYKNNVIAKNDSANVKTYPDGTQYSNYDYYYNGKKITTYADADNKGKYDDEVLGISELRQASTASLKVKDGNDYKLKGSKVLKNNTKYFYNSVGDYRTFHVLSMREAVKVKFNTNEGFLKEEDKTENKKAQNINLTLTDDQIKDQDVEDSDYEDKNAKIVKVQTMGYGEKLKGNESGREAAIPDGTKLIAPEKIKNKKDNYEFKGWALEVDKDKTYDELKNGNKLIYPDEGNTEKDEKLKPLKTALTASEQALKTKKNEFDSAYNEAADKCSVYLKSEDAIREAKKKDPKADVSKLEEAKTKAKAEYDKVKKIWDEKKAAYNEAKKDYDEKLAALEKEAKDTISYQVLNKKETTFYAVFGPKDQGKVNVKYVDESDNPISQDPNTKDYRFISDKTGEDVDKKGNKLTLDTKYPDKKEGNVGETIKTDDLKGPTFIGYKFKQVKTDPIPDPSATATYTKEGTYTIKFVYEKLPDIIPEKTDNGTDNPKVTPDIKETYVKVTFTNGVENKKFGKLYLGNTEPTEQDKLIESVSYYVNPREKKTIENVKANENVNVKVIDASKKVHETTPWIDNNSNEIKLTKEITDADKKDGITVNANYDDKGNGVAAIRYVVKNSSGTKTTIDAKYQAVADTNKYPSTIQGTLGTDVIDYANKTKNKKFEAPKFVGYTYQSPELLDSNKSKFVDDTSNDKATLDLVYTKEAEIIEKKDGTTIPDGYVDITFTNAKDGSKIVSKLNSQTDAADIVYSINPKAEVKIVKDTNSNPNKYQLVGKDAKNVDLKKDVPVVKADEGYKVKDHQNNGAATGWNYNNYDLVSTTETEKPLTEAKTFTAQVEQKGNGTAKLAYVDDNNATLDPANNVKLQVANVNYNPSLSGKDGAALPSYTVQTAPKVLGYVFDTEVSKQINNADATQYKEGQEAVITLKYKKLADVYKGKKDGENDTPDVPGNDSNKDNVINTVKDTYVKVKFLADEATRTSDADTDKDKDNYRRGKLNSTENEVFYYINPMAQNNLGGYISTSADDGKIVVPTIKPNDGYKKAAQEWDPDLTTKKSQAVDASKKELTFTAQYVQKGTGYVKVEYWADGTKLDSIEDYKLPGKTYINQKSGEEDVLVQASDLTNDYFDLLGYEKDTTQGIEIPANAKYETETANIKTVKFHYKKIDDIVGPAVPGATKPAGYVTIMFKADADNQNPARGKFGTNIQEVVYYVNPKTVTIDKAEQKLSGKNKDNQTIDKDFPKLTVTDNNFVANKETNGKYDKNGIQQWLVNPANGIVNNKLAQTITENDTLTLTAMYLGKFNVTYEVVVKPAGKVLPKPLDDATKEVTKDLVEKKGLEPGTVVDNPKEIDLSKLKDEDKKLIGNEVGQWSVSKWVKTQDNSGNITFTLTWTFTEAGKPYEYLTLTLDENYRGGRISDYDAYQGALIEGYLYRPHRRGYVFEGWSYNSRRLDEVRPGDRIEYSTILYAIWSKQKPKDDEDVEPVDTREVGEHKAYMFGYTDGTVRPNGYITRAEAAALVTRLLGLDTFASAAEPAFTDTPSSWYNKAINAAVQRGIMKGYPDKSFRPNAPITRAEFTQMISTIDNKPYGVAPFADVVGHWAERPIGSEYQAGRIKGYPDGTFRPNAFITRAEAVVILNKIFERNYDAMSAMNAKNKEYIKRFIDLAPSFWGFNDMVEATNTHLFKRRVKGEIAEDWVEVK